MPINILLDLTITIVPKKHVALLFISLCLYACTSVKEKSESLNKEEIIISTASCLILKAVKLNLTNSPLYEKNASGACQTVDTTNKEGFYYSTNHCQKKLYFRPTNFQQFCLDINEPSSKNRQGNAATWRYDFPAWTLYPSFLYDVGVLSISSNHHPFMQRIHYRSVPSEAHKTMNKDAPKVCHLEMRVYKKSIASTTLKPLIMFHGGGWKRRGLAFTALESSISHYTERGFIVFAPFYRLAGTSDGNSECNNASWRAIVSDAEAALTWVIQNGSKFGANTAENISLVGSSAGAHLSLWLHTYHTDLIKKTVLWYPPTDFADFIIQAKKTRASEAGEKTLSTFLGESIYRIGITSDKIIKNSFPPIIAKNPAHYKPLFIVHGKKDTLVPVTQSVRLCNALQGDPEKGNAKNNGGEVKSGLYSKRYQCNLNSELHIVAEGKHGLDACIPLISCPAGPPSSQKAIKEIVQSSLAWLSR